MEGLLEKLVSSLMASVLVLSGAFSQNEQKPYQQQIIQKTIKKPSKNIRQKSRQAISKSKSNVTNKKLTMVIGEMSRLGNTFIGYDHYVKLKKIIDELADSGLADKTEIERARKMLGRLNYDTGNIKEKISSVEKRDDKNFAIRDRFMHLESEIKRIVDVKMAIGPDHIARLNQQLNELSATGLFGEGELSRLKNLLVTIRYFDQESGTLQYTGSENCKNINELVLTHDITDFSKVRSISAPGADGGPKDKYKGHSFINTDRQRVSVYAPVEIVLESGSHYVGVEGVPQYILNFRVKGFCKVLLRFDHVTEPVDGIKKVMSPAPKPFEDTTSDLVNEEITFQAGELIGYTIGTPPPNGAGNWDFGLYDMSKQGALGAMGAYGQHAYAVCSWDFYASEKKLFYKSIMDGRKFVCDY